MSFEFICKQDHEQFIQETDDENEGSAGQQTEWEQSKQQVEQQQAEQRTIAG